MDMPNNRDSIKLGGQYAPPEHARRIDVYQLNVIIFNVIDFMAIITLDPDLFKTIRQRSGRRQKDVRFKARAVKIFYDRKKRLLSPAPGGELIKKKKSNLV